MKTVAYGWLLPAKAALRWAVKGQKAIEKRLENIADDPNRRDEYRFAKDVWQALRSAEVRIADELNIRK